MIRANRPDLLALQELRGLDADRRRLYGLATAVGMRPYLAGSLVGQPVALLVREPWAVLSARPLPRPFHHAAMRLAVRTARGPLTVVGAHLYPWSGGRRRWEAGWLARAVDPAGLALVMGDLNALDPWTDHRASLAALDPVHRARHLRRFGLRGDRVDTRAIARLDRRGLVDVWRTAGSGRDHTVPTAYRGGEFSRLRLDYILASEQVAGLVRRCSVVDGPPADTASDHYPVVADLVL